MNFGTFMEYLRNGVCVKSVRISPYSVRMRENTDQNNSEYGHFSQSGSTLYIQRAIDSLNINK